MDSNAGQPEQVWRPCHVLAGHRQAVGETIGGRQRPDLVPLLRHGGVGLAAGDSVDDHWDQCETQWTESSLLASVFLCIFVASVCLRAFPKRLW